MHIRYLLMTGTIAGVAFGMAGAAMAAPAKTSGTTAAAAQATNATVDAMETQIRSMEAQIGYMKRQIELMQQQVPAKPDPNGVKATLTGGRPQFASNDGNFKFNLQGRSHTDFANYFGLPHGLQLNNGVNERRAYLSANATFYQDWDATLEADFGSSSGNENKTTGYLRTALVTWNGKNSGLGNFKFDIGYMEPQFSFERGTSSNNTLFMERSSPEQIAAGFAADDRRFTVGARDNGNNWYGNLYYTGARTGQGNTDGVTTANIKNEQSAIIGRFAFLPWLDDTSLIHIGVNGQYVLSPNEQAPSIAQPRRSISLAFRPGLTVDSTNFISTGSIGANSGSVVGGEFAAEWNNLAMFSQYFHYTVNTVNPIAGVGNPDVSFDGFDVNFSYIVTGESRGYDKSAGSFGGVKPIHNFNPSTGDWGALELVARFEQTNLNDQTGNFIVEGGRQTLYEVGLNWYLNPNMRFMLDYIYADIRRAAVAGNGTAAARLLNPAAGSNLQPHINAIAARTQFSF